MQLTTMSSAVAGPGARPATGTRKRAAVGCARASRRDDAEFGCGGGRLVDAGMAVLRRRIRETSAAEYYDDLERGGDARELVAELLARFRFRPGVGVALVVLLALAAVPASAFVVASHILDASRELFSNLQR